LAAGCNTPGRTDAPVLLFPSPPAEPRVQFLTWASSARQVEAPKSDFAQFVLGDEPVNLLGLDKPYGVAARDGVVYVCDTKIPGVCRLDFRSQTFTVLGIRGPGRLRKPINLVIDPAGYKFIADALRKQIVVFGPDDRYVTAFDVPKPSHPVDVALWENELYVLDNDDSCQIVVLDRQTGEVLRTFGGPGEEPGQFKIPNSLCLGPDGHLYVSDTLNWRIQKLTRNGEPVWTKGTAGHRLGQFGRPRGLRVAPDGVIYVADAATEIVQLLSADGEVLMHFGGPGSVPGSLVLPATVAVDASSIPDFKQYIHEDFKVDYLLFVSSQYGQHLINVYAFGSFPEGYQLSQARIASLPPVDAEQREESVGPPRDAGKPPDRPAEDQPPNRQE
jgi:sugar lactone lactonase YvrE